MKKPTKSTADDKPLKVLEAAKVPDAVNAKSKFLGTSDIELQMQFMFECLSLMGVTTEDVIAGKAQHGANRFAAAISGIDPQDELQGMLAVQMFGSHNMIMTFCRRAIHPEQTTEGIDANVARATRLMRVFLEQIAAIQKLKGQGSQQKVTVEHVHVHQGGQAIVGAVTSGGEGEG